jgi:hypothetical protein
LYCISHIADFIFAHQKNCASFIDLIRDKINLTTID